MVRTAVMGKEWSLESAHDGIFPLHDGCLCESNESSGRSHSTGKPRMLPHYAWRAQQAGSPARYPAAQSRMALGR